MSDAKRYGKLMVDALLLWKLAALKCFLFSLLSLGTTWAAMVQSGLDDAKWAALGTIGKTAVLATLAGSVISPLLAFLDKTIASVKKDLGIESDDTTHLTK